MNRRFVTVFGAGFVAAQLAGWLALPHLLYARSEQPLPFSHARHASADTGMGCADCHALGADGRFTGIPNVASCAVCHSEPIGSSAAEKRLVDEYVKPGREIPWLVYSRQPENVRFPHAVHVKRAALACERCHGDHGSTDSLRPHETNRVSGYSRDIWGPSLLRVGLPPGRGMKMSDCEACHAGRARPRSSCLACHK